FMIAAPERIRVNCDLRHVNVVLCCDPKAFTHTNPLDGMSEGGSLVWESEEEGEQAWERLPLWARKQILDKKIRVFTLPGFQIARNATDRGDLQLRMQGNAFLGAFFAVSPMLQDFGITQEQFRDAVHKQYVKKFGRLGDGVVKSNMEVMTKGFELVREINVGALEAPDRSTLRGKALLPVIGGNGNGDGCGSGCRSHPIPEGQQERTPLTRVAVFDAEFRSTYGYDQPASPLAALGVMAAGSGDTASKYVARRETPLYIPENCTQCMECIAVCPDTALPNCSQDFDTILRTAITNYVEDPSERQKMLGLVPEIDKRTRELMRDSVAKNSGTPLQTFVRQVTNDVNGFSDTAKTQLFNVLDKIPMAYQKANAIFATPEKKKPGGGGIFSIFVSDLCKGCAACVTACGEHEALRMVQETEEVNAEHESGTAFLDLLPDTPQKYLGLYNDTRPQDSKTATLRNMLMVRRNYDALVSGDGACAGCGEKSILRAVAAVTEAYMRPLYHAKADRLRAKADELDKDGVQRLTALKERNKDEYDLLRQAIAHMLMGLGGEDDKDTRTRMAAHGPISDRDLIDAITAVMRQEAFNHKNLQPIDGRLANGMSVMAMAAHTGCNTVYGSTPPNNPHPYPWMNSLFQDGITVGWLMGESFIVDHGRRSVIPERLFDALMHRETGVISPREYYEYVHFSDALMTDQEILELPKVWVVGGDGGMGDIGYQNMSKVILQNRPNIKAVMLDTQVYSNTGGQNSDSTPMLGGNDMNVFGAATQGKNNEKKTVAETFLAGHGSPFVAQVSIANAPKLYRSILDGLEYRGTAFLQCFTTCQPEHGVPDDMALTQAQRVRDSRGAPEFVFNPRLGETYQEALDLKGNPSIEMDWYESKLKGSNEPYRYTVAHWCATEARFRNHLKKVKQEEAAKLVPLENMLVRITQQDVVYRRYLREDHRAYVPDFGVYIKTQGSNGDAEYRSLSRQLVLFCVERRKAWRMLQSKAGIENREYKAQRALLVDVDAGKVSKDDLFAHGPLLLKERMPAPAGHKPAAPAVQPPVAKPAAADAAATTH
ncbi:MAG: 2-oxoacid:acceptor oxidoreductase family protein, partial [Acidobacteria bacterium]|nr:2-oxoacid:acceptor oxidoreductase family protein [Acidobacteriota bacterium]